MARVRRPEAVTPVELIWRVPSPPPLPAPRARATPLSLPSMHDLAALSQHLTSASSLAAAAVQLQRDVCRLLRASDAVCIFIDWPRRTASTIDGPLGDQLQDLALEVAGSGRRALANAMLVEPLGPPPTRAVLALRKPAGFDPSELTIIRTVASAIAPTVDRLIALQRLDRI